MLLAGECASDRNLLFGILALQLDFVDQETLVSAMRQWLRDKSQSLAEVLQQAGQLSPQRRELLDSVVAEHLAQHRDDVHESLASLPALAAAQELLRLADTDLRHSLAPAVTVPGAEDPHRTVALPVEKSTCRYNVLRPLGKGGLGLVWVARDAELHREVALKEIQPRLAANGESRVRFLREAEITGGLEHPGIVPVYGLGSYPDGRLFYAMRLINGESMRSAIVRYHLDCAEGSNAERGLGLRKLLNSFIDACNAVAYAHSRNVLHRDIKPDNIMLGRFGETLVVDWGLAKVWQPSGTAAAATDAMEISVTLRAVDLDTGPLRLSSHSTAAETQMGSMLGTPQFMSPEQAAGRLDLVGPASDIYSLGATLYGLLTGQAPFAGADLGETIQRVRRGEFEAPRQVLRDIPPPLEAICLKAMSLSPGDRYASASELAAELERWLSDEPVRAYAEPWRQRVGRWSRRHRAWTMAGALALFLVALIATLSAGVVCQAWKNEAWALAEVSHHLEQEQREHNLAVKAHHEVEAAHRALEHAQAELAKQITQLGLEEQLRHSVQSKPLLREIAADRIEPLHERIRVPTAQDVSMQSWACYRASRPERLAGRTTIYLFTLGPLSEEQQKLSLDVAEFLTRFYGLPTGWLDPAPASNLNEPGTLERVITARCPRDAVATIGLTGAPLATAGFCRDAAVVQGAVLSFAQLGDADGSEGRQQTLRRLLKAATCAVGRAVGMRDFSAYHCGLNAAASLTDLDTKPLCFCPECEQKVWWLADLEPLERYKQLVEFAAQHGLEPEHGNWQKSLDAVRTPRNHP